MDEIAVGGVNFDEFEAGLEGFDGGHGLGVGPKAGNGVAGECFGLNGFRGEGSGGGRIDGPPSAFGDRDGVAVIAPGNIGGGFETGVGELGSGDGSVLAEEANDLGEFLDVVVFPDSEVIGTDSAFRHYGCGFGENRAAPPMAREPRWTRCQSLAKPSSLEYSHMGETAIRLRKVTSRI